MPSHAAGRANLAQREHEAALALANWMQICAHKTPGGGVSAELFASFRAAETRACDAQEDNPQGELSYAVNALHNFADVVKRAQKANASADNAIQMDPEKLDALVQASKITGGANMRTAMAYAMNYFGATKKQSMAPRRAMERAAGAMPRS